MSTADYPDALTRRIEQLAAASVEEPEGEGAAVAALVGALRAEIGAVRAELGSLRSETGAVRSDLDGLGGRLTGSVAASRSETGTLVRRVAELSTRIDSVGGRVDDVRNGLPSLSRELREGLSDVPVRTSARLDELTGALTDAVGQRMDGVASDIHRTLTAGRDRESKATDLAALSLEEARGALESRLAALEDALDAMSERLEALARDGASTTNGTLTTLAGAVEALAAGIEAEGRDNAELLVGRLRDVTETRLSELENTLFDRLSDTLRIRNDELRRDVLAAIEANREQSAEDRAEVAELASSVRTALDGFGAVLERSIVGLGRSVTTALSEGRAESRTELDDVTDRLLGAVSSLRAELAVRDETATGLLAGAQSSVEGRVDAVRTQLSTAMTVLRSDVATELGTLTPRVDELVVAGTATGEAVRALRSDVLTTVEELRDRVVATTIDSTEVLRSAMTETRAEIADITRALREDLLDRIEEKNSGVADRLVEVSRAATAGTAAARESGERLTALTTAGQDSRREVTERLTALEDAVAARLAALDTSVARRADELQGALDGGLRGMDEQLAAATTSVRAADEQVAALVAQAARHRVEIEQLLEVVREGVVETGRDVRKELVGKTESALLQLTERLTVLDVTVDERQADVAERLAGLDAVVARTTAATERVAAGLVDVSTSADTLTDTVSGFRSEWPTRTFEVVQGAKAVAEGVVRDIRVEVQAQLEQVRAELARAVGGVQDASSGISSGTDRLSRAGKVLVGYLEQRDRLLEAERDQILHEVLDSFAAGLSAKERTALSVRVADAVSRRRDTRDADRYRSAVGQPTPPVLDLPDEVLALEPADARTAQQVGADKRESRAVPRAEPPAPGPAKVAVPKVAVPKVAVPKVAVPKVAVRQAPATKAPATKAPATKAPATKAPATKAPATKAPATKAAAAKATRPSAAEMGGAPTTTEQPAERPSDPAAAPVTARTARVSGGDRRARVDVMPEARSPEVALEAAAPTPVKATATAPAKAVPAQPDADAADSAQETSWASRPAGQAPPEGEQDDDASMRRLFRRRKP
ncbi:MAG: hypothetical protein H7323_10710 [Frankiales bacterium]|nr:hypothetical protein [Frankiales bacterium]